MNEPRAYYNEHDSFAAGWLRNLIAAGLIAPGDVDERSIVDVSASDLIGYTQCHFFAGIGGWSLALRLAGWHDDRPVWTGSCPCQPFSAAGAGKAADDERHLWPAWLPLIAERRPAIVLGEQVEAAIGWGWLDAVFADLEGEGYACGAAVLPACGVGAPHIRQRLWFVADAARGDQRRHGGEPRGATESGSGEARPADGDAAGSAGALGHAEGRDGGLPVRPNRREDFEPSGTGEARNVGDSRSAERDGTENAGTIARAQRATDRSGQQPAGRIQSARTGSTGELGDAAGGGLGILGDASQPGRGRHADGASEHGRVVDTEGEQVGVSGRAWLPRSPLNDFWRDAEWIACTDGKARPVGPGSFPRGHGIPRRPSKLRAYGNAIVPQVAAEFIAAFLETEAEAVAA